MLTVNSTIKIAKEYQGFQSINLIKDILVSRLPSELLQNHDIDVQLVDVLCHRTTGFTIKDGAEYSTIPVQHVILLVDNQIVHTHEVERIKAFQSDVNEITVEQKLLMIDFIKAVDISLNVYLNTL